MSSLGRLSTKAGLGIILFILGVMPLSMLFVPEPEAVRVSGLAGEISGAYLRAKAGTFKLYPYATLEKGFPKTTMATTTEPTFLIKYKALENLTKYGIYSFPESRAIPANKKKKTGNVIQVSPRSDLKPGRYYLQAAKDSMYGGSKYFFFRIPVEH